MNNFRVINYRIVVVFVAAMSGFACGVKKHWLPDLEWQTASNWIGNNIPETDSRVIFPLQMRHAVGMPKSVELRLSEIDLPRTGSLVLPRDGKVELTRSGGAGKEISKWSREGHIFWADPENWNGTSIAAPHLERVPCRNDDVVLPSEERTLSILLPMKNIQVRSIRMSDKRYPFSRWQWDNFWDKREFTKGRFTVRYSSYSCEKCACQDDAYGDYFEEICAIQRPKCGFIGCEYPLTVEGHCCRYCGGRILLSSSTSLSLVRTLVSEALNNYKKTVAWYVRETWNGAVEILFKEKATYAGTDTLEVVEDVKHVLESTGIKVLSIETAGAALEDNRIAVALGPLFGVPLVILILLLAGFSYFGYSLGHIASGCVEVFSSIQEGIRTDKQQSQKPFGFARFENVPDGNVEIAKVPSTSEQSVESDTDEDKAVSSGGRFENPLYRSNRKKEETPPLKMESPLSLAALKDKEDDHAEEVEMDINE